MITFYEADGLDLRVSPVVFDPGSSITTLIGAVVEAHAKIFGDVVLVGTGTVLSATAARVVFAPWVLTPGEYELHVRATPPGTTGQTIFADNMDVIASIKPRP